MCFTIEDFPTIMSSNNDLNISPSFAVNISLFSTPFSLSDISSSSLLRSSELFCSSDVTSEKRISAIQLRVLKSLYVLVISEIPAENPQATRDPVKCGRNLKT